MTIKEISKDLEAATYYNTTYSYDVCKNFTIVGFLFNLKYWFEFERIFCLSFILLHFTVTFEKKILSFIL